MRVLKVAVGIALAASLAAVVPAQAGNGNSGRGNSGNGNSGNGNGNSGNGGGGPVVVTPPRACGLSDLSVGASACGGFVAGNLLSNSPSDVAAQTSILAALGLSAWDGSIVEPQLNLSSSTVDFSTALYGLTFVGIHFGAGTGSPSPQTPGGVTGFYRFDAGTNLDAFTLAFGSASAARLYLTQPAPPPVVSPPPVLTQPEPPPLATPPEPPIQLPLPFDPPGQSALAAIPEPATWLTMILGFGFIGGVLRARRPSIAS